MNRYGRLANELIVRIRSAPEVDAVDSIMVEAWTAKVCGELTEPEVTKLDIAAEQQRTELRAEKSAIRPISAHRNPTALPRSRAEFYTWRSRWRRKFERDRRVPRLTVCVLSYIADALNGDPHNTRYGQAWRSLTTMAKDLEMRKASVVAGIKVAETLGYLNVIRVKGRRNKNRYGPRFPRD